MSSQVANIDTVESTPLASAAAGISTWSARFDRLEHWLAAASDRLNPILVKETRQALKSKQFAITFVLLLIFCWVITIGGVAMVGPGIYYSAAGGVLLKAYYFVLLFPLTVVVPYSAFRSLSAEREENTYDLLRVSTLLPRQIISGKLASAIVQLGVYFSAVAPCLAFTYLLRGIDVLSIAILLTCAVLGCIGLSIIGLFAAALAHQKQGQIVLSVGFVTLLLGCFWFGLLASNEFLDSGTAFTRDWEFWAICGMIFTGYATTFALCFLAAVSLITFRTENRSTPLRWVMLIQQAAFIGWMAFLWILTYDDDFLIVTFFVAAIYWYVMGTLLTGEMGELSHRVRRKLPQSTLGRFFLGWFNPGPGTGYFFAVANLTSVIAIVAIAMVCVYAVPLPVRGNYDAEKITLVMVAGWAYVVAYLGIGKLLITAIRRLAPVTSVASFLLHVLLVLAGAGIPYALQMSLRTWRNAGYNPLQWSNPFWTIIELIDGPAYTIDSILLVSVLLVVACCVLLVNLPSIAGELRQVRVALPSRVAQDEAELHPVIIGPQNPWETDEVSDN